MTNQIFKFPSCFKTTAKNPVDVHVVDAKGFKSLKIPVSERRQLEQRGFSGGKGQVAMVRDKDGLMTHAYIGFDKMGLYSLCPLADRMRREFSSDFLKDVTFRIVTSHTVEELQGLCIGWGLSNYTFDRYKKSRAPQLQLLWPAKVDKARVMGFIESVCLIRSMVNTPPSDMGTEEMAEVAKAVAEKFGATISVTKGKTLEKEFPMIHAVGKASPRAPLLLDLRWGKKTHKKVTLVGKGIVFDTGGLNIKTGKGMALMKKDMGGAAHALACAYLIMAMKLPVNLTVLLPCAENAIAGNAFRPSDVITARNGVTVEIDNTDAEGRLVVGDALAFACESEPDVIIDFCTLTGAAKVALGYDIPAFFSNSTRFLPMVQQAGMDNDDPVWPLPLWEEYNDDIASPIADISNDGRGLAGCIYGALFLNRFVKPHIPWVHLDLYAWEQYGRPGRPQGGADNGMRAIFHFLEKRYGKES